MFKGSKDFLTEITLLRHLGNLGFTKFRCVGRAIMFSWLRFSIYIPKRITENIHQHREQGI
jgi:hypothetical protein